MRIDFFRMTYLGSIAMGSSFRRIGKGEYILEQLHEGSLVPGKPLYLVTKTFKVGFLSFSSYTKAQPISSDEAGNWLRENCGEDAYAELLLQQERGKKYYEATWGGDYNPPLLECENVVAEK